MKIKFFKEDFSVVKLRDLTKLDVSQDLFFLSKTPDELSLVCPTQQAPENALKADHGWKAFRVEGELDFALVGILARITGVLAEKKISVFAVSTYDTDYVLIKQVKVEEAREALREAGYEVA